MTPLWFILIATIGRRYAKFSTLLDLLLPQTEPYGGRVQVRALWNNGERPLSHIRQGLVMAADAQGADYVSFVDDDDRPADVYVAKVWQALTSNAGPPGGPWITPEYVGWRMQHYADGRPSKPTYHSLQYGRWFEDERGYYRDISHLNPISISLTRHADFRRTSPPEDVAWSDQLRGLVTYGVDVDPDTVMYHYYSSGDSTWMPGRVRDEGHTRIENNHPNFRYIEWDEVWDKS